MAAITVFLDLTGKYDRYKVWKFLLEIRQKQSLVLNIECACADLCMDSVSVLSQS